MKQYATLAVVLLGATANAALSPITVKGNAFFNGTDRFYIRGLDYQPGGSSDVADPLIDSAACKRDIKNFIDLGLNTIRVYTVDNTKNHDECMSALEDAGIYLILDVNSPLYSINQIDPAPSYNSHYLQNIFATMDMFSKYDNTLAFFSGNEVINDKPVTVKSAPYVKAVTRDMKQYRDNRKMRPIPIGYSAADVEQNRVQTAHYLNCGTDDARGDFFAFNDYSWCDPSSFTTSGWDKKVQTYADYSVPIFLSEHGCNKNTRTFGDISSLYSDDMTAVYSGGLVYEYSQEPSDYGLVQISGNSVKKLADYTALKTAYAKTPPPTGSGGYRSSPGGPSQCPPSEAAWPLSSTLLPAIPDKAVDYMTKGAGAGPGLSGPGSQTAGDESTSMASPGSGQPTTSGSAEGSSSAATPVQLPPMGYAGLVMAGIVSASMLLGASLI